MGLEFPEVLLTSYVARSLPTIKSADLNALQREQIRTWKALRGEDILINEQFTGDQLNRGVWVNQTNNPTLGDDAAAGGAGAATFDPSASSPRILKSRPMIIGTSRFRLSVRMRATLTGLLTSSVSRFGLWQDADDAVGIGWWMGVHPRLSVYRDRMSAYLDDDDGSTLDLDGGTGIARDGAYHVFELIRNDNEIQFLYDGGLVASSTSAAWVDKDFNEVMSFGVETRGPTNYYVAKVDAANLWVERSLLTEAVGGSAPAVHYEELTAPVTAASSVVITWDKPFADTSYLVKLGGFYRTDSATAVGYTITAKSTSSITVSFGTTVTGQLYVEAHD